MKNFLLTTLLMISMFAVSFANGDEPKTVPVGNSEITWKGFKVGGMHKGTITLKSGILEYNAEGVLTGGNFVLDMGSIACTDLEGGSKSKLEGHLKSDDFFGVEAHPTANLTITKVSSRGEVGAYKVVADLTIKGITNQVKFNVRNAGEAHVAEITVDRSDYDVKYGSGSFFDKLGDNTIYDEFVLSVYVKAKMETQTEK